MKKGALLSLLILGAGVIFAQTNRTYIQCMPHQSIINGGALLPEPDGTVSYSISAAFQSWTANDSNITWPNGTIPTGMQAIDNWEGAANHPYRLHWDLSDSSVYGCGPYEHNPQSSFDSDIGFVMQSDPTRTNLRYASLAIPNFAGLSKIWNVQKQGDRYYGVGYGTPAGKQSLVICLDDTLQLVWAKSFPSIPEFKEVYVTGDGRLYVAGGNTMMQLDLQGNLVWAKSYPSMGNFVSIVQTDADRFSVLGEDSADWNIQIIQVNGVGDVYRGRSYNLQGGLGQMASVKMIPGFDNSLCMTGFASITNAPWNVWVLNTDTMGNLQWANAYHVGESDCVYDLVTTSNCNYVSLGTYYATTPSTLIGTLLTRMQDDGRIMNPLSMNGWLQGPIPNMAAPVNLNVSGNSINTPLTITQTTKFHQNVNGSGFFAATLIDSTRTGCQPLAVGVRDAGQAQQALRWRSDMHTFVEVSAPDGALEDGPLAWQLTALNGQAVARGNWDTSVMLRVDLAALPSGIYVLHWPAAASLRPIKILKF